MKDAVRTKQDLCVTVVLVAGGKGRRLGGEVPKQFRRLQGVPVFMRALLPFQKLACVKAIALVVPSDYLQSAADLVEEFGCDKVLSIVAGGSERADSVRAGLHALRTTPADVIAVHDGARPFVTADLIEEIVAAAAQHGAAVPVLPISETVKLVGDDSVIRSLDRTHLRVVQTPQAFFPPWLHEAYERCLVSGATDESWLVEACGFPVHTVKGRKDNLKLTHAEDWVVAERMLVDRLQRVGVGYDVHSLVANRPLILGGINIPADRGLAGHSDADVLVHAMIDAMLGAVALPDIGQQFPDSDAQYRGIDSCVLLAKTASLLREKGWQVSNVDCIVAAQSPKLAPFVPAIKAKLAITLAISEDRIGIKATTTEGLGFVGRHQGMCAWCVVMITSAE